MEELAPGGAAFRQAPGRPATHLHGRELGGGIMSSGNFGSSRERFEKCQERVRCQERSRLPPAVQDKAAISLDVGECATRQHEAPKDARIKGWFMRLSSIWYLSVSLPGHMGNAKRRVLMRKLQAEHLGVMLCSRGGDGIYLQISWGWGPEPPPGFGTQFLNFLL